MKIFLFSVCPAIAQVPETKRGFEIHGYIKTDIGFNFNQIDPNWFDVMRVTKLPQFKDQFAPDGKIYFSARETRLGFNGWAPTPLGQVKVNFEFDLFGVGSDVGRTTFHFRKAYVELGRFSVGQNQSLFTDVDVTPNTLDFGAPPSRPFLRSVNLRYMQVKKKARWGIALEQPGATSDEGIYAERIDIYNVRTAFKLPDVTTQYRRIVNSGYIEVAGVLKWIKWENTVATPIDLSGDELGWGFYVSSTQRLNHKTVFKGQVVYGRGMENYLTDAGPDIGIKRNPGNTTTPILGVSLPVIGGHVFLEYNWTDKLSSTVGCSRVHIHNSDAQAGNAFKNGNYGIVNLLYVPFSQFMTGVELQWGQRNNFSDGFKSSAVRLQFSCKYNFSHSVDENKNK
ncbi:MAG: hypothetical protein EOO04_24145 [Chitinophagaceae bacterium]|nr:MAG: hypothetical protein EOO04_24145 [Chitinophagaceae bacterium]